MAGCEAKLKGFDMKTTLGNILPHPDNPHHSLVDSKALFDTITTLHECGEFRLRKTITMIRDSFQSRELDTVTWIPGTLNTADALTKRGVSHSRKTNERFTDGHWSIDTSKGMMHYSRTWKGKENVLMGN